MRPAIVEARLRGARLEVVAKVNVVENSTIFGHTQQRLIAMGACTAETQIGEKEIAVRATAEADEALAAG